MSDSLNSVSAPPQLASTLPHQNSVSNVAPASQQQHEAATIKQRHSKTETNTEWLARIRNTQMSNPELASKVREHAAVNQSRTMHAKKLTGMSHRTTNAKTSTYVAMSTASAPMTLSSAPPHAPQQQGAAAGGLGGFFSSVFGTANASNNNNNNNNAAPPPASLVTMSAAQPVSRAHQNQALDSIFGRGPAPTTTTTRDAQEMGADTDEEEKKRRKGERKVAKDHNEAALMLMDQMEEDDEAIAESYAMPVRAAQLQLSVQVQASPMVAQRESEWLHSSNAAGWGATAHTEATRRAQTVIQASSAHTAVTETEEQAALRLLSAAPKDDEEAATKFQLFEKFSDKVSKLRGEFDVLIRETVEKEMPQMVRDDVKRLITSRLESANARGIHDESQHWFARQMFVQVSKNADSMAEISEDVARRLRLLVNTEAACPICLESFDSDTNVDDDTTDAVSVERLVLPCCHNVCTTCWAMLTTLNKQNCVLCRGDVLVEMLAQTE